MDHESFFDPSRKGWLEKQINLVISVACGVALGVLAHKARREAMERQEELRRQYEIRRQNIDKNRP